MHPFSTQSQSRANALRLEPLNLLRLALHFFNAHTTNNDLLLLNQIKPKFPHFTST